MSSTPDDLDESQKSALEISLGKRVQNQIYRQILLGSLSELWVEYLTRVEALRVSIGLEAFAQRDPLVQYKSQASEMFKNLLSDIRSGVISRMFIYQPRRLTTTSQSTEKIPDEKVRTPAIPIPGSGEKKKKRKRH